MNKKLLTEFFELCPNGRCLDMLSERQKREVVEEGAVYLTGRIQTAGKKNGNGRVYPKKVLEKEITNYQKIVRDNRATGELDHPEDAVINLKNVSHLVVECWWQGDDVMGKIKVLDTPSGRILKDLINAGVKLGISSRGLGSVNEGYDGTVTVNEDFQLICFDIVSEPSTPNAFVYPEEKMNDLGSTNFKIKMKENKQNQIEDLFNKILRD
tara:strand:- start:124 stop:756 length:633 start_codon:yes stop_codon:yes gene_type:complete